MTYTYLIDTESKSWYYTGKLRRKTANGHRAIFARLAKLKSTKIIVDLGAYREDASYSLIQLESILNEAELEAYLNKNNLAYIGIVLKPEA
jgi:hypothetical protein